MMCPRRFGCPLVLMTTCITVAEDNWFENKSGPSSSGSSIEMVGDLAGDLVGPMISLSH